MRDAIMQPSRRSFARRLRNPLVIEREEEEGRLIFVALLSACPTCSASFRRGILDRRISILSPSPHRCPRRSVNGAARESDRGITKRRATMTSGGDGQKKNAVTGLYSGERNAGNYLPELMRDSWPIDAIVTPRGLDGHR